MEPTEIIELLYKAMPDNNLICNLDIRESAIYFSWDGCRLRVSTDLFVEETDGFILSTNKITTLVEHILKTYKNK